MFGTYRMLLALMVALEHIGNGHGMGGFAVMGFYVLSGYLMTFIMHNNYGYTKLGMARYSINRFLKIYPMYWMALVISAILVFYAGEDFSSSLWRPMYIPRTIPALLRNLFIFFPTMEMPRLIPPAWALTVEIFFYILIGAGLSKNRKNVVWWVFLSAIYPPFAFYYGWDHYFSVFAASLPFSLGALAYHYQEKVDPFLRKVFANKIYDLLPAVFFGWFMLNWFVGYELGSNVKEAFFWLFLYLNFPVCAILVIILSTRNSLQLVSKPMDKWMGDLSYPIYLIHEPIGLIVKAFLVRNEFRPTNPPFASMLISLPFIILAAWILSRLVGQPLEMLRLLIKKNVQG